MSLLPPNKRINTPPFIHLVKLHLFLIMGRCNWWSQEEGAAPWHVVQSPESWYWWSHWQLWAHCCCCCCCCSTVGLRSSPPHTALLHRDDITETNGRLGPEHLVKLTFFLLFSSVNPFNQHQQSLHLTSGLAVGQICQGVCVCVCVNVYVWATKASHACKANAFLFALVTVQLLARLVALFPCHALWDILHPSELMATSRIPLHYWDGLCEESAASPNEFPPSNFSPSCRLGSIHIWHLCNWLSCWTGRPRRRKNGCYSDVRRAFKQLSLRSAFVDDWLWSEDDGLAQPFTFQSLNAHPVMDSHFPSLFLLISVQILLQWSRFYPCELHSVLMIMITVIKLMINDCWGVFVLHTNHDFLHFL